MLWPEGSAAVLADIGMYIDPPCPNEEIVAFSVSKVGSYIAVASRRVLAMFRIRPLAPLAIYPESFPDTDIVDIIASPTGSYLAVLTSDNRVASFSVKPKHDIEEVLKMTYVVTPGPGEAIGARELWLEPVGSIYTEDNGVALDSVGSQLVVYTRHEIQCGHWVDFETNNPLKPVFLVRHRPPLNDGAYIVSGVSALMSKKECICCSVTSTGEVMAFKWFSENPETLQTNVSPPNASASTDPMSPSTFGPTPPAGGEPPTTVSPSESIKVNVSGVIIAIDFNVRMKKSAVVNDQGKIFVFNNIFDPDCEPVELPTEGKRKASTLQWTPAGTALLVGYTDGWQSMSMLGLTLYNCSDKSTVQESVGLQKASWMLGAESVLYLGTDGKSRLQNMLRWCGLVNTGRSRSVSHGNGRLMLYHDPTSRGVAVTDSPNGQSWLTIPLPTWYMAQNWPIAHISSSPDGRFVAVAGTAGIMMFSVVTRQWKEVGNHDAVVRGGLCWHGRRLVAATVSQDTGTVSSNMFSPIAGSNTKNSSASLLKDLWSGKGGNGSGRGAASLLPAFARQEASAQGDSPAAPEGAANNSPAAARPRLSESSNNSDTLMPLPTGQLDRQSKTETNSSNSGGSQHHRPSRRASSQDLHGLRSPTTATTPSSPGTAFSSSVNMSMLNASTAEQQIIASDVIGKGPSSVVNLMSTGPNGLLGVLTGVENQRLLIYDLSMLEFDLIRDLPLANVLNGLDSTPVIRAFSILSESQVLVLAGTMLLLVSSVDDELRKYQRQIVAEPIETFVYLPSEQQLWVFDGQDAVVTNWSPNEHRDDKYLATISSDAYPVHISSNRGVVSLVECEPVRSFDASFTVARPVTTHEVFIQYVLESALVPAYATALSVARKYSRAPYFAGVLESLSYRVVTNDDYGNADTMKQNIELAIQLSREFPEQNFEAVVAGCARKVEMKYWPRLFEAVGKTPAELFDACLQKADLETANEYLIVVQTSSTQVTPEPENGMVAQESQRFDLHGRILTLYNAAVAAKQFWICRQVCEFVMALDPSGSALKTFYNQVKKE